MSMVVIFDENATPQKVLSVHPSINEPPFFGRTDVVIDPDLSALGGISSRYWKHDNGAIVEMTAPEKVQVDTEQAEAEDANKATEALGAINTQEVLQATVLVVKEEINILRGLHALPDRTNQQVLDAIRNKINTRESKI